MMTSPILVDPAVSSLETLGRRRLRRFHREQDGRLEGATWWRCQRWTGGSADWPPEGIFRPEASFPTAGTTFQLS